MPPRSKQPTEAVQNSEVLKSLAPQVGDFLHVLTKGGAKYKGAELLECHSTGVVIRTALNGPTTAEISFIPWNAIDGIGLIGKR